MALNSMYCVEAALKPAYIVHNLVDPSF